MGGSFLPPVRRRCRRLVRAHIRTPIRAHIRVLLRLTLTLMLAVSCWLFGCVGCFGWRLMRVAAIWVRDGFLQHCESKSSDSDSSAHNYAPNGAKSEIPQND